MKTLHKSESNKVLAGVCGGLGDYFGVDPVLIRLAWALTILFMGTGLLAYIICAFVIPTKPEEVELEVQNEEELEEVEVELEKEVEVELEKEKLEKEKLEVENT